MKNNISIEALKCLYDNCVDIYIFLFCEKQEVVADGWVADIKGGVNIFSDAFLSFEDIRTDIDFNSPKGLIFDWYWDNVENPEKAINYYSYIKGLRIKNIQETEKIF